VAFDGQSNPWFSRRSRLATAARLNHGVMRLPHMRPLIKCIVALSPKMTFTPVEKLHMNVELSELFSMVKILAEDADHARAVMDQEHTDYSRRVYVRAVFAWIEGVCFLMRQYVLRERLREPISADAIPELAALMEDTYTVNDAGQVKISDLRTPTPNNLIFSILALSHARGFPLQIDKSGKNWQDYRRALKIRDRITHPKTAEALKITDEELQVIRETHGWFCINLKFALNAA